jgi:trimeric autotransporter adhesin
MYRPIAWVLGVCLLGAGCYGGADDVSTVRSSLLSGMSFYFGNLHAHSKYSDGAGTPAQGFAFARDVAHMHFYAITDHAELLSSSEWSDIGNQANAYNSDGTFVALRGFEYTNYLWGHINVFATNSTRSFWNSPTLSSFYTWIDGQNGIGQFNHPGSPDDFSDFSFSSRAADNMALLETANAGATNASNAILPNYDNALRKGWKVAPTGNNDNETLTDLGRRTVLVASGLTRAELLSAMRARRMYSSDDHNLEIAFVLNGAWMGSTVSGSAGTYTFDVALLDDEAIALVELIANGAVASQLTPAAGTTQLVWNPTLEVTADTYAYLKVTEADTEVSVTAPIWIDLP